jgi:peptidoglycan/LPS O-acetylase OafA/YrhL
MAVRAASRRVRLLAVFASGSASALGTSRPVNNVGTLRLLAALLVLYAHCFVLASPGTRDPLSEALAGVMPFGRGLPGLGVFFFFVISGYLITQSFERRGKLGPFLEARALRIFPALWGAVLLTVALGALVTTFAPAEFLRSRVTVDYLVHNLSLIDLRQGLPGVFTGNPASEVNVSLWTLPIELGMYGLVAVLGVAGIIRARRLFNGAAIVIFALYLLGGNRLPILYGHHESELALFFVAGAILYVNRDLRPTSGGAVVALTTTAIVASVLVPTLAPIAVVFAFASAVVWLGFNNSLRLPDLSARGDLSYATYLYACPVTQLWILWLGPSSPWLLVALTTAATLPLAWLSWWLLEQPALRQKGRILTGVRRVRTLTRRAAEAPTD